MCWQQDAYFVRTERGGLQRLRQGAWRSTVVGGGAEKNQGKGLSVWTKWSLSLYSFIEYGAGTGLTHQLVQCLQCGWGRIQVFMNEKQVSGFHPSTQLLNSSFTDPHLCVYVHVLKKKLTTLGSHILVALCCLRPREHGGYERAWTQTILSPRSATSHSDWRTLGRWLNLSMGQFPSL